MNIVDTKIDGLFTLETNFYSDERGSFSRIFCQDELKEILKEQIIKQVNHSITNTKGTVRGLHFQYAPNIETKIVKCIRGSILDVVVDIRKDSETFLEVFMVELNEENQKMIVIPKGFAHGFQTLEDNTELLYFHTSIYTPSNEGALSINDPLLKIHWPLDIINLSDRDKEHKYIDDNFKGIEIDEL